MWPIPLQTSVRKLHTRLRRVCVNLVMHGVGLKYLYGVI